MPSAASGAETLLDPGFLAALDRLSLRSRRMSRGQLLGSRRSLRHGASVEFTDYRDYAAGDDLRTIDWKAYGRLEKLLVKLFREEDDLSLHFLLDASESMAFGSNPGKLLFAKRLCAALGAIALLDFDRCTFTTLPGGGHAAAKAQILRGRSSLPVLLAALTAVQPSGEARLADSIAAALHRRPAPGVMVIVSDFYRHGLTSALLARAGKMQDVVLVHVAAREEINPALMIAQLGRAESSEVRLIDSETGEALEITLAAGAIEQYQAEFARFRGDLAAIARSAGASYTLLPTDTPLSDAVLGSLRRERVIAG